MSKRDRGPQLDSRRAAPPVGAPDAERLVPAERPASASVPLGEENGFVLAVMGGATRKGQWEPPEHLWGLALMGGIEIDFREADLFEGTTEVTLLAAMGGVKVVVPPDVDVEVSGIGLLGSFEHQQQRAIADDAPRIKINGLALMGGVEVKVKR